MSQIDTLQFFALAAQAQRQNGGFFKVAEGTTPANKTLLRTLLENNIQAEAEDVVLAQQVIDFIKGYTFKQLTGDISDYEKGLLQLASSDSVDVGEKSLGRFNVGIIASAINAYNRGVERIKVNERLQETVAGYLGECGAKVQTKATIQRSVFSQKYFVYFITAITESNHAVFFSYKSGIKTGTQLELKGSVKRQADGFQTQLNRVKILTEI